MLKPTAIIKAALEQLCRYNKRTRGAAVADMYLGRDIFIARLHYPKVIEGTAVDVDETMDILDLIAAHQVEILNDEQLSV